MIYDILKFTVNLDTILDTDQFTEGKIASFPGYSEFLKNF